MLEDRLEHEPGTVARLARRLLHQIRQLTTEINQITDELETLITKLAPSLLAICGCGVLTAAKILGETAGIDRFHSRDAYARFNGTAPLPVWSSNRARHRLNRTGNRQLNAALHRIALVQAARYPDARTYLARRRNNGDGGLEALRALKRRLSDVIYRALHNDQPTQTHTAA
jgi:transposase